MILSLEPFNWNSAHRPIEFIFDHENEDIDTISDDGGFLKILLLDAFTFTPDPGERIYVSGTSGGTYDGYHVVDTADGGGNITTTTEYTIAATGGNVIYIRLPQISLYKGYDTGEQFETELPLELLDTWTPENSPDNNIYIDVSGWLKRIFTTPLVIDSDTYDFGIFNRFRLEFDGDMQPFYHVLDSAIDSEILDGYYADTGRPLHAEEIPSIFDCGDNIITYLYLHGPTHTVGTFTEISDIDTGSGGGDEE